MSCVPAPAAAGSKSAVPSAKSAIPGPLKLPKVFTGCEVSVTDQAFSVPVEPPAASTIDMVQSPFKGQPTRLLKSPSGS